MNQEEDKEWKKEKTFDMNHQTTAIAINPNYDGKGGLFVCGIREEKNRKFIRAKVIYQEKKLFSGQTTLYSGNGEINAISWKGDFIAWANTEEGIYVYNIKNQIPICKIPIKEDCLRPLEKYPCRMKWIENNKIIIAWANQIHELIVTETNEYNYKLVKTFPFIICGIAPYNDNYLMLTMQNLENEMEDPKIKDLFDRFEKEFKHIIEKPEPKEKRIEEEESKKNVMKDLFGEDAKKLLEEQYCPIPDMRIITKKGEIIFEESIMIRGYEFCSPLDLGLEAQPNPTEQKTRTMFFLYSPFQLLEATERNIDDQITWLMERLRYSEAFKVAQKNERQLKKYNVTRIGEVLLGSLLVSKDPMQIREAAKICPIVCADDQNLWVRWISQFFQFQQFEEICPYIPIDHPRLQEVIYEMILNNFLENDNLDLFLQTIRKWPKNIYNQKSIILIIEDKQKEINFLDERLALPLADLYLEVGQYEDALTIYLTLERPDVFEMITANNLLDSISTRISDLADLDERQTITMLVNNTEKIPIKTVVEQLETKRKLLCEYFKNLSKKDPQIVKDYQFEIIKLTNEFDPQNLIKFLKSSDYIPLEEALTYFKEHELFRESVYILKRMGNTYEALDLIFHKLKDMEKAIKFIQHEKDPHLLRKLVSYCVNEPVHFPPLLKALFDSNFRLEETIRRVPEQKVIPGLGDSLKYIIENFQRNVKLSNLATDVVRKDCGELMHSLHTRMRMGFRFNHKNSCPICNGKISQIEPFVSFFCGHTFHLACLKENIRDKPFCTVCSSRQRDN
eukprot:Anaeramoba_ignava/c20215_g1_i5.p1 GENE.c20215_g1_i5~~c20215_g1_i5.p1  ORF type:complete len:792 (-),score=201.92 c20215_g1_i5:52-2427(-)